MSKFCCPECGHLMSVKNSCTFCSAGLNDLENDFISTHEYSEYYDKPEKQSRYFDKLIPKDNLISDYSLIMSSMESQAQMEMLL